LSLSVFQSVSARTTEETEVWMLQTSAKPASVLRSPNNEALAAEVPRWGPGSQVALEERDLDLSQGAEAELMTKLRTAEEEDLQATQAGSSRTDLESASVVALVQKAREADPDAWKELVSRFGGMIAATGRRYRLTAADVAELQQTTWLRLVENLHRIEQPERVGGWLATTARRESLQLLKRASKYGPAGDQMIENMADRHLPEPDARPIAEERGTVLNVAWERLQPRCQRLLSLLISDDPQSYKDVSKLLEMPVGSIGPTRARCLEHLRRLVEEEGITDE
jgi:RNA polymerase sigma factor (sigma-70 family)